MKPTTLRSMPVAAALAVIISVSAVACGDRSPEPPLSPSVVEGPASYEVQLDSSSTEGTKTTTQSDTTNRGGGVGSGGN